MKFKFDELAKSTLGAVLIIGMGRTLLAQGTAFTYEGRLNDTGQPANGVYDFRFTIYDSTNTPGIVISGPVTNSATGVTNGLFTVVLDFGSGAFTGPARWLEVSARTNLGGPFITLTPRQPLTASPYAILANSANNLLGTLPPGQLNGTYTGPLNFNNPSNTFCGNGSCLVGVNANLLDGLGAGDFWQLAGNLGTTPGVNFLGTRDDESLVLKVNNSIAVQYAPAPYAPNVIAGLSAIKPTVIFSNVSGAFLGGGGAPSYPVTGYGAGDYFAIFDNDCTIGGGFGNKVGTDDGDATDAAFATVGGGVFNWAAAYAATVAGGDANYAAGQRAAILGGYANQAWANLSSLCGGLSGLIESNANNSVLAGGAYNTIGDAFSVIGGGSYNAIQDVSSNSVVAGGYANSIQATYATIGGGWSNFVAASGTAASIGGGQNNIANFPHATIAGGYQNIATNIAATVGGGEYNVASGIGAVVAGGGYDGVVAGNLASGNASVVSGGDINTASGLEATVGGGEYNTSSGRFSTVSGGNVNTASGNESTIPGGYYNLASGNYSYAAGFNANATNNGAFVWSDGTGTPTYSTNDNSVTFRATGGFRFFTTTAVTGAQLPPGATSWGASSDRNVKKNIESIDYQSVLQKLADVPIARWNYKWEPDDAVPHIGPMAQDFKQAFYPGRDDKIITTLEFDGVELAAIQALNLKLEEQRTELKDQVAAQAEELKAKQQAIEALEQRLEHIEREMSRSMAQH